MIRIHYLAFIILFICVSTIAQENNCDCNKKTRELSAYDINLTGKAYINKFAGKNEQFFNYWSKGDIYLSDGNIAKGQMLRYNGLLDEVLWMREGNYQLTVLDRNTVRKIVLYNDLNMVYATFLKVNHKNIQHPENDDMFLQVLTEGKVALYKKMEVVENSTNGELERKDIYILFKGGEYSKFKPFRWRLYQLFGDDKETLKSIIRNNHLKLRSESDLIQAISLFNSYQSGASK